MIYLDHAATSFPKPAFVTEKNLGILNAPLGNPGRSGHPPSRLAADTVFRARESVARLIGLKSCERIVFTSGATAALNMAIHGICKALARRGSTPLVATEVFEHNSVLRPLYDLERNGKIRLLIFSPDSRGRLPEREILSVMPQLFVLTCRSNVTGHSFPQGNLLSALRKQGCILIMDAAQALGSGICTMESTGAHVLCAPGHKGLMGMMGGGFLAVSEVCPLLPEAIFTGGSGNESFREEMPDDLPERLEAGTLPVPAIASMGAGAEFLLKEGVQAVAEHERAAKAFLTEGIANMKRYRLYEPEYSLGPLLINHRNRLPEELAELLSREGIMVRAGFHCAPLAHRHLGTEPYGGVRLSPGPFVTRRELETVLDTLWRL